LITKSSIIITFITLKSGQLIWDKSGQIIWDVGVTHLFLFQNSGDDILEISKVRANCNCLTANVSNKNLKPEEKSKIGVSFRPLYKEGIQEKNVFVHTNDPDFPIIKLTVMAQIKIAAIVEPKVLVFSNNTLTQKVKFHNRLNKDLRVISIESAEDFIAYEILNNSQTMPVTMEPNQELDILVSLKNYNLEEVNNDLSSHITIHTDYFDHPAFKIFITSKLY